MYAHDTASPTTKPDRNSARNFHVVSCRAHRPGVKRPGSLLTLGPQRHRVTVVAARQGSRGPAGSHRGTRRNLPSQHGRRETGRHQPRGRRQARTRPSQRRTARATTARAASHSHQDQRRACNAAGSITQRWVCRCPVAIRSARMAQRQDSGSVPRRLTCLFGVLAFGTACGRGGATLLVDG
jgi:hypothetical protein